MLGKEEVENRVGFHKATIEGDNATLPRHAQLRRLFKQIMNELDEVLPSGREKSVCMERLEDTSMWAHKALAKLAPLVSEDQPEKTEALSSDEAKIEILNRFAHLRQGMIDSGAGSSDLQFIYQLERENFITNAEFYKVYPNITAHSG